MRSWASDRGYANFRKLSAAYPALYLRQLDLGGVRLAQINGLLLAVLAVVEADRLKKSGLSRSFGERQK